jgi:hypothetical protein
LSDCCDHDYVLGSGPSKRKVIKGELIANGGEISATMKFSSIG